MLTRSTLGLVVLSLSSCTAEVPPGTPTAEPTSTAHTTSATAPRPSTKLRGAGFDRGAAAAALTNVDVQACKTSSGPTGTGHVMVTFIPDGTVSTSVVDGGPFPGTPEGGCIAAKFKVINVPPFDGTAVRVGKMFEIQ